MHCIECQGSDDEGHDTFCQYGPTSEEDVEALQNEVNDAEYRCREVTEERDDLRAEVKALKAQLAGAEAMNRGFCGDR
jgi:uncharacterized membrane protein